MISRNLVLLSLALAGGAFAAETKSAPPAATPATPAAAAPRTPAPAAPAANPGPSIDTFRIIGDRNIFNANRTGRRDRSSEDQPARFDLISFVGTIDYAKGYYALFDGSEAGFRKGFRVGDSVGQFKIVKVTADRVELERDGKSITMSVGQQLRRAEGGDWTLIGADVARAEAQAAAARQQAANAPPALSNDVSDIERRMRERRAQQSKQP